MPAILRHVVWGSLLAAMTAALLVIGWFHTPWWRSLTGEVESIIELVGALYLTVSFATGFECSRIEAASEERSIRIRRSLPMH
jgi:hypothetical protein